MKSHAFDIQRLLSLVVASSMLLTQLGVVFRAGAVDAQRVMVSDSEEPAASGEALLFRTRVTLRQARDIERVEALGALVLAQAEDWALLLVTDEQLQALARLGFGPRRTDELATLIATHRSSSDRTDLQVLEPLLTAVQDVSAQPDADTLDTEGAEIRLHRTLQAVTAEQEAVLLALDVIDSDGDGLSDTEEGWWCTDPYNPNSDGDVNGYADGEEVTALLDFTLPRTVRWGYGPPFGPPNAWPDWNGQDGNPNTPACNDGDYDTIPDLAEVYMVGTRVPEESTDGDKFDDGQELFGTTYCPGAPTSCGYGNYPRIEYWNYIQASMPTWVRQPGDNPFVAAFPVPEVFVTPNSWTVERVTTITTAQGEMVETSKSYSTTVTRGQGSSIANTVTWNEWEEVSEALEVPVQTTVASSAPNAVTVMNDVAARASIGDYGFGTIKVLGGSAAAGVGGAACLGALGFGVLSGIGLVPAAGICLLGVVGGELLIDSGIDQIKGPDPVQPQQVYSNTSYDYSSSEYNYVTLNQNLNSQGIMNSLDGVQYAINQQGHLIARGLQDVSYAISQPRLTETRTSGQSWGGAQTTTHEEYEEHSIGNTEQFTAGQNWSTAWAVDSSHAAQLTFNYTIRNTGTEYAREITGLVFNIYLGDDTTPLISYPAWQQFAAGKLENVFPGQTHSFASNPVPLTLEQMKRIDLGEQLIVVLEDFSYGADELFYENAVNGGITFYIEDGVHDDDEEVDMYVMPTWGVETVQDVLGRYFPTGTDAAGNLNSLTTPEFSGTGTPVWNEHFLSNIAWWNVYLTQSDAGNTPLHELPAEAGSALLFRFNRDSDRDGYQDRVEWRYGTDINDPASHPQPEILAGYTTSRDGDEVTVLLKLANSGSFDAYGIDAVIYAPDDTATIGNNTVGGNGRVRPGAEVAVGSLVLGPELLNWSNSTARPYATGNFVGSNDRVITFTVSTAGTVGQGSTALSWLDSDGGSGSLDLGSGYHAPLPLDVSAGVQVGFDTGTLANGERFAVMALTPRDTFRYTINSEPYTRPVIVVSYSDPQGSHRFVTPIELGRLQEGLAPYAGQMLPDVRLEIATQGVVNAGENTTTFTINSPHPEPIVNGHLYLNFVSDGELVSELPYTMTVQPGPGVHNITWSTDDFSQPYDPAADNILIAFWTDAQGNIIDSAARPLNTFQADPQAKLATDETQFVWNIGTARQGTLMQRRLVMANTGFRELLEWVGVTPGLAVSGPASSPILPADMGVYTLSFNTENLPIGPYSQGVVIRTSDAANAERTLLIQGEIVEGTPDGVQGSVLRPLDYAAHIPDSHSLGEWVEFAHNLGPSPQTLHPAKVFSEDYATFWGVGKYTIDFSQGANTGGDFGDGGDGDLVVTTGQTVYADGNRTGLAANAAAGQARATVSNASVLGIGKEILIIQMQGTGVGNYEFARIVGKNGNELILASNLKRSYTASSSSKAQVIQVRNYQNLTIQSGGTLAAHSWNGTTGGVLAVKVKGIAQVNGNISANGTGYRQGDRGEYGDPIKSHGWQGESYNGLGAQSRSANNGGGGGGQGDDNTGCPSGGKCGGAGGGGGGYGSTGTAGQPGGDRPSLPGSGGNTYGAASLAAKIYPGSGGGGGGSDDNSSGPGGYGGSGGGIILLATRTLNVTGYISANGNNGSSGASSYRTGGGGGGAAGSILITGAEISLGSSRVRALGGTGAAGTNSGGSGGSGSAGRIHVQYCNTAPLGTANPAAYLSQVNCHLAEQVEDLPYNITRLRLPEAFTVGRTYQVQYGRRLVFGSSGQQTESIRIQKQLYTGATMDALVSNTGTSSGSLDLSLDIGSDGTVEWNHSQTTAFPASLSIDDLVDDLNAYLISRTDVAWGANIDVPVNVQINRAANVILTNLVLSLQINQPDALAPTNVDTGADRPLDWTVPVTGSHTIGEWIAFSHTLQPDPQTLHPVSVYSHDFTTLWGVGKYATDFGEGIASPSMFGDGSDGNLAVGTGQTFYVDSVRTSIDGSVSAGQTAVPVMSTSGFAPGNMIIIHQSRGAGAGTWEVARVNAVSQHLTLAEGIQFGYVDGGSNQAQVVRIPQYVNVTINTGGVLTANSWNGNSGGILAFVASGTVTVQGVIRVSGGSTSNQYGANGGGFRGGNGRAYSGSGTEHAVQGEGISGPGSASRLSNANGGGGGQQSSQPDGNSGAGGGHATSGLGGTNKSEQPAAVGGSTAGSADLTTMVFGGGGGGGIKEISYVGAGGGAGGGIVMISADDLYISGGSINANGGNGASASGNVATAGGGGAGGSILLRARTAALDSGRISAVGGSGGTFYAGTGGNGGTGRIRVEYCDTFSGSTTPAASIAQLNCYIVEQVEETPYETARLQLPETFEDGRTYAVQFGRRYTFTAALESTDYLRIKRQVYGDASVEALVSNTASGSVLDLALDIGADGSEEWREDTATSFPVAFEVDGLAAALNDYLLSRNDVAWGGPVDVPVTVGVNREADVILTNLALTPVGSKTRYLRLAADNYGQVTLSLRFSQPGVETGRLSFTVDVGADGSVDWSFSDTVTFPAIITSDNLAAVFNAYLDGHEGVVDVPLRIIPSPFLNTTLYDATATLSGRPDLTLAAGDIMFDTATPSEGEPVIVTATISNVGSARTEATTVAFIATPPEASPVYIGSDFLTDIPAGGTALAGITWDTTDFAGTVPVRVIADPFDRLGETNELNNEASAHITVLARPDLTVTKVALNGSARQGIALDVEVTLANNGQTDSELQSIYLYKEDPDHSGTLIGFSNIAVAAGDNETVVIPWVPDLPGPFTLYAVADANNTVAESNEDNNRASKSVYVGWGPPLAIDAGGPDDPAYDSLHGYGYLTAGTVVNACGTEVYQTYRQTSSGTQLQYRFDHLLPERYYHLDLTFFLCSGSRDLRVLVDGIEVGTAVASNAGQLTISLLLHPAMYTDNSIVVAIEKTGGSLGGPVVSELVLSDIRYCYRDSGAEGEAGYAGAADGCGWLDGEADSSWGILPHESVRYSESGPIQYRFDGLEDNHQYRLNLTFYEDDGIGRVQDVLVDGVLVLDEVALSSTVQYLTATVPVETFGDGSIVVQITEASQPVISEIGLEEVTATVYDAHRCYTLARTKTGLGSPPAAAPASSSGCPEGQYVAGEVIQLTAEPDAGWHVSSWNGTDNDASTATTNQVTMPATSRTVTVNYEEDVPTCYLLTRTKTGSGAKPTASPSSSPGCAMGYFVAGEVIQLTAAPDPGWHVGSWNGTDDNASTASTNQVTMPATSWTVTVNYEEDVSTCYLLKTEKTGSGSEPTASPISSPGCATGYFVAGEVIQLTAAPAPGWRVSSWSETDDDTSTATANQVTMPAADRTVTVHYAEESYPQPYSVYLPLLLKGDGP
jgi:hypothetical protein